MKKFWVLICSSISIAGAAAEASKTSALGSAPPTSDVPQIEFAFEERVTIDPAVVQGETPFGHRQYIPITGGTVAGPKLKGVVVPGGWDYQLTHAGSKCTELFADYFLKADDGTLIHVLNQGMSCPGSPRMVFRPKLEAPKGAHEWMTQATFVATLEIEGTPPKVESVRIRFYQVK